jgi:hypothetical protein
MVSAVGGHNEEADIHKAPALSMLSVPPSFREEIVARPGVTNAIVYERRAFTRKLRCKPGNHRGTIGLGHRP